jgi:hypothetical protein
MKTSRALQLAAVLSVAVSLMPAPAPAQISKSMDRTHTILIQPGAATQAPAPGMLAGPKAPVTPAAPRGPAKALGGAALPDLQAVGYYPSPQKAGLPAGFPGVEYCTPMVAGGTPNRVRFRLVNTGSVPAGASTVRVTFSSGGAATLAMPPIPAKDERVGNIFIPDGCYKGQYSAVCQFTITADAFGTVAESNEANNSRQSYCVSPAG